MSLIKYENGYDQFQIQFDQFEGIDTGLNFSHFGDCLPQLFRLNLAQDQAAAEIAAQIAAEINTAL